MVQLFNNKQFNWFLALKMRSLTYHTNFENILFYTLDSEEKNKFT